jgi:putative transposase
MNGKRFSGGARFRWQGVTYQVNRLLPDGEVNLENILTGSVIVIKMTALVSALFNTELEFVSERGSTQTEPSIPEADFRKHLALSDYPAHLVSIARYRLEIIQPLISLEQRTRAAVQARVQEIKGQAKSPGGEGLQGSASVAAVYRWIRDYTRSGNDLRALIPDVRERGGKEKPRLRLEIEHLTETVIERKSKAQEKITIEDVRYELAVRIAEENQVRPAHDQLSMPSRATLARRVEASRASQGKIKGSDKNPTSSSQQYGKTPYPSLPLERVEIDHTRSDLVVIDDRDDLPLGRLTLTYCLDMATRYPLGYYLGFEPPSYLTAMECLHHAICPKPEVRQQYGTEHEWLAYGIPATLVIDNGKEFIGRDLEDACLLLGIVLQYSPLKTPQFKAGVERMFGSLNTMFFHVLPGTTFSNPEERGNYKSAEQACVYLSEVDKMLNIFLVDIYAERFHRGLNSIPASRWEETIRHGFAPALPPSAEELSILLGRTADRVIHPYGIEFASLRYNCADLVTLRTRLKGKAARIKYHPGNLSRLYVFDEFEQQYTLVPALDQEYTHELSLWKHRVIRQAVLDEQAQVDMVALGRAKRKIQQIVEDGRLRKRQSTRSRIARWDTAGKPSRQVAENQSRFEESKTGTPVEKDGTNTLQEGLPLTQASPAMKDDDWEVGYVPLRRAQTMTDEDEGKVTDG